jgi:hypothetical protein
MNWIDIELQTDDPVAAWALDSRPLTWRERVRVGYFLWRDGVARWPLPVRQTNPAGYSCR